VATTHGFGVVSVINAKVAQMPAVLRPLVTSASDPALAFGPDPFAPDATSMLGFSPGTVMVSEPSLRLTTVHVLPLSAFAVFSSILNPQATPTPKITPPKARMRRNVTEFMAYLVEPALRPLANEARDREINIDDAPSKGVQPDGGLAA
jgi:hypothetical protein